MQAREMEMGMLTGLGRVVGIVVISLVIPAFAQAEGFDPIGTFGTGPGATGGEFSNSPGGIAVNDSSGDLYLVDTGNNRLQRFDADGNFLSAWGADVISGAAGGTGTLTEGSALVTSLRATAGAFSVGQVIVGTGIPGGTRVVAVTNGATATLTLSKPATASGGLVPLSVSAAPNNLPVNEQQRLTVSATSGNFRLTAGAMQGFAAATTNDIPYNATAAQVETALGALLQIGLGNVTVSEPVAGVYTIEFINARADTNMPQLLVAAGSVKLEGGTATIATLVQGGSAYEICTVASECKAGVSLGSASDLVAAGGSMNQPQGVAIDQVTGNLYVSNAALQRVEEFSAGGGFIRAFGRDVVQTGKPGDNPPANAVQTLNVSAASGRYTLEFQGQKTGELPFNASAATIQAALQGLSSIAAGNVTVAEVTTGTYRITFAGALANNPEPDIIAASAPGEPLAGGSASVTTTTPGSNGYEICQISSDCQKGSAGSGPGGAFGNTMGYPVVAPDGAPGAGNLLVGDNNRRLQEFTSTGVFVRGFGWDAVSAGPDNTGTGFEVCRAAAFDVCKTGSAGTEVGQFPTTGPARVAEDTTGTIYTVDPAPACTSGNTQPMPRRVQRFVPGGSPELVPSIFAEATLSTSWSCPGGNETPNRFVSDVAVDPVDNHVYVVRAVEPGEGTPPASSPERRVLELDPSGALIDSHGANAGITSIRGLAVKAGGERLYLTSSAPSPRVVVLGPPLPPTVTLSAITDVNSECATFHGLVNPNGGGALHTSYRFEYSSDAGASWTKPAATDIGSGESAVPVENTVCGLQSNKDYLTRLVAIKGGTQTVSSPPSLGFKTDPAPPSAETYSAYWDEAAGELVLRAGVNPHNSPTSYYFEYGQAPCPSSACLKIPAGEDGDAGSGNTAELVVERVSGLSPGTTYHYRIVAGNGIESAPGVTEVRGAELTLKVPDGSAPCPNETLRSGASTALTECRAYEWVSAGDSWGVGVNNSALAVGDDGTKAQFKAQAFGLPQSSPGPFTPFTSVRESGGWSVKPMLPEPDLALASIGGGNVGTAADLSSTLWLESSLLQRQRAEMRWGMWFLDGSSLFAPEPLVALTHAGPNLEDRSQSFPLKGEASDLSTFVFTFLHEGRIGYQFLPDEPLLTSPFSSDLYEISGAGGPSPSFDVVNRADGTSGAVLGGVCGAGLGDNIRGRTGPAANAVSRDGNTIYFTIRPASPPPPALPAEGTCGTTPPEEVAIGGPKRLFKRVNGEQTVAVSESNCNPACGGPDGDDSYRGASGDGSVAFFVSPRRLLNGDADGTEDLYVYDADPPPGEPKLAQASAGESIAGHTTPGTGAEVAGVLDNAADGSRVYFTAKAPLTGANSRGVSPKGGEPNLYVYERDASHPAGRIGFIGTMDASDAGRLMTQSFALPRSGDVGDGHLLLFTSAARMLPEDRDSSRDLYRYDDTNGELLCLSCMGNGQFDVTIPARGVAQSAAAGDQEARPASADVSTVAFSTGESLLAGDTNSGNNRPCFEPLATGCDVYLWHEGALSDVSVGAGETGAQSTQGSGVSPDGSNVFFYTRAKLAGADTNNAMDLYDARVDGGFPEAPSVSVCANSDQCQGAGQGAPAAPGGGSDSFAGPGNVKPTPHCRKGKVRRKGRCVKKPRRRHGHKSRPHRAPQKRRAGR